MLVRCGMNFGASMQMAKVRVSDMIDGEAIATENYNIPRNEFVAKAWKICKGNNTVHRTAIEHYDVIRRELDEYEKFTNK